MKKYIVLSLILLAVVGLLIFAVPTVFAQGNNPPIVLPPLTPAFLSVIVAGILAVIFDYVPGAASWYDGLTEIGKRQIMALLLFLTVAVIFTGKCFGFLETNMICSPSGALDSLYNLFLAVTVNQGIHNLTKPSDVYKAKVLGV